MQRTLFFSFLLAFAILPQCSGTNLLPRTWIGGKWVHSGPGKFSAKGLPGAVSWMKLTGGAVRVLSTYGAKSNDRRYLTDGMLDRGFEVTAELRGKGRLRIEVESKASGSYVPGPFKSKTVVSQWFTATDKWQKILFKGVENNPWCDAQYVTFRMASAGEIEVRRPALTYPAFEESKLLLSPVSTFVRCGEKASFNVTYQGKAPLMLRSYAAASGNKLVQNLPLKEKQFTIEGTGKAGTRRVNVSVPAEKLSRIAMVTELPKEKYDMLAKKAAAVKLPRKMKILFLGDSLTDYYRGHNYTDMVRFFLDRSNPGMIITDNRGIGGDNCRYMIKRLTSVEKDERSFPNSNGRARYFNMFNQKYDRIYLFIGANDSKVHSKDNWQTPYVTLPDQLTNMRAILKLLQRKFPGVPIVILGAPNYHWEIARSNAMARVKRYPGKNIVMFCQEKDVQDFNSNARKAAAECNVKFIENFSVTSASKERKAMFEGDGVHLALPGEVFFAGVVLDDLAGVFKK